MNYWEWQPWWRFWTSSCWHWGRWLRRGSWLNCRGTCLLSSESKIHDWIEVDNDFVDVNLETEEDDFEEEVDLTVEELHKRESKIYDCIEVDNDLVDDNLEKVKNESVEDFNTISEEQTVFQLLKSFF